ncbi:alpha/beta-Hydrolases superfamily protein [Actinidia rufa]|uniref:Alpha/beta-Hydrolases superfamily protein n=1 Tax=Actinidia rufa TaxID=165716 RepID=A0A7J0GEA8_9ERIC|nr:alpha/beta-Hydrolases superfamily protein [Actinidia rufa]
MEGIEHRTITVNGINMHIAEKGKGPIILFVHGFPELWYSWRHQILHAAASGYRAVAPDLRGYGGTTGVPSNDHSKFTVLHVVGDLVALIDAIAPDSHQVFVVGHDWGALITWYLCLFRPDRVRALVLFFPLIAFELALAYSSMELGISLKGKGFGDSPAILRLSCLAFVLSKEDVDYYASKFEQTGFTGGINYYRAVDLNWELTAPWTGSRVKVPTKFIVGDLDLVYNIPGVKEYIRDGGFKKDVPLLDEVCGHGRRRPLHQPREARRDQRTHS